MWTTDGIHTLPGMSGNFQPNHFVPLVEFIAKNVPKRKPQPKITDLLRSHCLQNDQSSFVGKLLMMQLMFHIRCNYVISTAMYQSACEGTRPSGLYFIVTYCALINECVTH